jgi:hypothetical protein
MALYITPGYELDDRGSISGRGKKYFFNPSGQTGSGAQLHSYLLRTGGS